MTQSILLPDVDFGQAEAEADLNAITMSFYEGDNWRRATDHQLPFVIGRKGSGKSAIATRSEVETQNDGSAAFLRIVPAKFRHVEIRALLAYLVNKTAGWQYIYSKIWEGIILGQLVKYFSESMNHGSTHKISRSLSEKVTEFKCKCPFYVAALDDALTDVITNHVRSVANKTDELSLVDLRKMLEPYNWGALSQAIHDDLLNNSNLPKKIIIAIDGLDEHWDNSEESLFFLAQLLSVTKKFTSTFSPKIKFLICLRDNIFRSLVDTKSVEYDKLESLIVNLEWNSRSLFELIAKRVLPGKKEAKALSALRHILPESIDGIGIDDFLGRHLLNRPRDYINFFRMLQAECGRAPRAGEGHVRDVIAKYGANRLIDLENEFGLIYPGISKLISAISRLGETFDKKTLIESISSLCTDPSFRKEAPDLLTHYGDPITLSRILLSIGAIGYYKSEDHALNFVHEFSESRVSTLWNTSELFGTHPVYRSKGSTSYSDQQKEISQRPPAIITNPTDYLPSQDDLADLEPISGKRYKKVRDLVADINSIEKGQQHFRRWEIWVKNTFDLCFSGDLLNSESQITAEQAGKRFEIIYDVCSNEPPWNEIKERYKTHRLLIECKNTDQPTDDDFSKLDRDMASLNLNVAFLAYRGTLREPTGQFLQYQRARFINSNRERVIIAVSQAFLLQCLHKKSVDKCRNNINSLWRDHLHRWLTT